MTEVFPRKGDVVLIEEGLGIVRFVGPTDFDKVIPIFPPIFDAILMHINWMIYNLKGQTNWHRAQRQTH